LLRIPAAAVSRTPRDPEKMDAAVDTYRFPLAGRGMNPVPNNVRDEVAHSGGLERVNDVWHI